MALFGKKKQNDATGASAAEWQPEPHKAAKFFEHARTVAQTGNFAYAIDLYARGIRFDPGNMTAHEAIYEMGIRHQGGGKAAPSKEVKAIDGPNPADRMAAYEFAWARDINNLAVAMKLIKAVAKASKAEFGEWLAPRIFAMMTKAKKQNKNLWVTGKAPPRSMRGRRPSPQPKAIALDPSDSDLISELNEPPNGRSPRAASASPRKASPATSEIVRTPSPGRAQDAEARAAPNEPLDRAERSSRRTPTARRPSTSTPSCSDGVTPPRTTRRPSRSTP